MKYEITEDILTLAGFEVVKDPDQDGMWVWVRRHNGQFIEGCESSFDSQEQAWNDVREMFFRILGQECGIGEQQWAEMSAEERMAVALKL